MKSLGRVTACCTSLVGLIDIVHFSDVVTLVKMYEKLIESCNGDSLTQMILNNVRMTNLILWPKELSKKAVKFMVTLK